MQRNLELNEIPRMIENGILTEKQALNMLAAFVIENQKIFGLQKNDADFVSEVILMILEKGERLFSLYKPELGSFFNYFFSYVKSQMGLCKRQKTNEMIIEHYTTSELISDYSQGILHSTLNEEPSEEKDASEHHSEILYEPLPIPELHLESRSETYNAEPRDFSTELSQKIKKIELRTKGISKITARQILTILALKSAYYITEEQVQLICELCALDAESFQRIIDSLRLSFEKKAEEKRKVEQRRNSAYFQYKKLEGLKEYAKDGESHDYQLDIEQKYRRHAEHWQNLNERISKGMLFLRPTTATIARIMGISERQINYYCKQARLLGIALEDI